MPKGIGYGKKKRKKARRKAKKLLKGTKKMKRLTGKTKVGRIR